MEQPVDVYGKPMAFEVEGAFANIFSHYDPVFNSFIVEQYYLEPEMAGQYIVTVTASCDGGLSGQERYGTYFTLTVHPPGDEEPAADDVFWPATPPQP